MWLHVWRRMQRVREAVPCPGRGGTEHPGNEHEGDGHEDTPYAGVWGRSVWHRCGGAFPGELQVGEACDSMSHQYYLRFLLDFQHGKYPLLSL